MATSTIDPLNLEKRVIECARNYLVNKGFKIIQTVNNASIEPYFNFVAHDVNGCLVFVGVTYTADPEADIPEKDLDRKEWERKFSTWLAQHIDDTPASGPLRVDTIGVRVVANDRAIIRHHINALAYDQDTEE